MKFEYALQVISLVQRSSSLPKPDQSVQFWVQWAHDIIHDLQVQLAYLVAHPSLSSQSNLVAFIITVCDIFLPSARSQGHLPYACNGSYTRGTDISDHRKL